MYRVDLALSRLCTTRLVRLNEKVTVSREAWRTLGSCEVDTELADTKRNGPTHSFDYVCTQLSQREGTIICIIW